MCRDQNLISETDGRTDEWTDEHMKIEKPGVGRPLLGPAKNSQGKLKFSQHMAFNVDFVSQKKVLIKDCAPFEFIIMSLLRTDFININ